MNEVHIHPDKVVIVRKDGVTAYCDTVENFKLDFGQELESLPSGWSERLYIQGVMDRLGNGFTQETTTDSWPQGDSIINKIDDIIAAKQLREAPVEQEEPQG